jgi:hypothetical protein
LRKVKCRISIGVFVVYIDTESPLPNIPSNSRGLADENKKLSREWKWFEISVLKYITSFRSCIMTSFLAFSVRDISIKYFICIKDFDAQTITSLKLNLFSSFIYCCQHHERKTICLDIFLLSDRQWGTEHQYLLGCSVFFASWRLKC